MSQSFYHLRLENPELLAQMLAEKYVNRGIRWLNANAPLGWHRNLFEPQPGNKSYFRVDVLLNIADVVALAFESRKECVDQFGYVTHYKVCKDFGLSYREECLMGFAPMMWGKGLKRHAIRKGSVQIYEAGYLVQVTMDQLQKEWETQLRRMNGGLIPHRHMTPIELEWSANTWPAHSDPDRSWIHTLYEKLFPERV